MSKKIRIVIADDHQMLIDGIKSLLKEVENIEIVDCANNGTDALQLVEKYNPDILLSDINMPGMGGLELARILKQKHIAVKIISLSMYADAAVVSDMLQAGVSGYVLKNTGKEELVAAINKVYGGGVYYSAEISDMMMRNISGKKEEGASALTVREIEIVKLIGLEMTNAQIGDKLFISERTVETHRKNIFRKTNTKTVVGLLKYAYEHKLLD
ncbi:MAG: response regulator transcription factor [Bacteroidetes bacterium]|nr:response regulator transcription factor [Bacteroidota bacterium]HNR19150.1 response regulator transcription factor [Bacteroidia bacterium]HNU32578.1 response regulator transcription factor [Bacteroidia bacterium]